jgi:hypothetical protein
VIGAFVGILALYVVVPRVRQGLLIAGLVLAVVGAAFVVYQPGGSSVVERFRGDATTSNADSVRRLVLRKSWHEARDHLATGIGFSRVLDSHSLVIQFLLAGGIVALASFCFWIWKVCGLGFSLATRGRGPPQVGQLAGAFSCALVAWLVPGLLNPQLLERFMYIPAGLLLAMGYLLVRVPAASRVPDAWAPWSGRPTGDGTVAREPVVAATAVEAHRA